jgi:hypothetical protein
MRTKEIGPAPHARILRNLSKEFQQAETIHSWALGPPLRTLSNLIPNG